MSDALFAYVVKQGDYLTKLAYRYGFDALAVWKLPANESLRKLRQSPDILFPGDILHLPIPPDSDGLDMTHGTSNRYRARVPKVPISVAFNHPNGTPLANEPFEVRGLILASSTDKKTDDNGTVHFDVPVTTREFEVVFPALDLSFILRVGDLNPSDENSGLQQRLRNLGYYLPPGRAGMSDDDAFSDAIRAFQMRRGFDATGQLDERTRDELLNTHGG